MSRAVPAASVAAVRYSSNVPAEEPKKKAQSIIDALPGSSLLSKTAILSSSAALSIYALSNEYYVMNEETVVAVCLLAVWGGLIKYGGPGYKAWAEAQNEKIKNILNSARADHTEAVKTRIEDVKQMSGVVEITKDLFAVSKVSFEMRGAKGGKTLVKGPTRQRNGMLTRIFFPIGNRHARGSGFRARAADRHRR
jgi:F-type H+-transporting ATPase subunit b